MHFSHLCSLTIVKTVLYHLQGSQCKQCMGQHFLNQLVKLLNKRLWRLIHVFCWRKENMMSQTEKWNKSATQNGPVTTIMSTKAANICKAIQISIPIGDFTSSLRDIQKIHQWHKLYKSQEIPIHQGFIFPSFQYIITEIKFRTNNNKNAK